MYLIENGYLIVWFFLFPLIGLLFNYLFSKKTLVILLIISGILTLPVLLGHSYVLPFINELLFFITFSLSFASLLKSTDWKYPLIFSGGLFVILGIVAFCANFFGTIKTKERWTFGDYKIELLEERGFSGGPLMSYKLSEYDLNHIFIRELEIYTEHDSVPKCEIKFIRSNLLFDKCKHVLKKTSPNNKFAQKWLTVVHLNSFVNYSVQCGATSVLQAMPFMHKFATRYHQC